MVNDGAVEVEKPAEDAPIDEKQKWRDTITNYGAQPLTGLDSWGKFLNNSGIQKWFTGSNITVDKYNESANLMNQAYADKSSQNIQNNEAFKKWLSDFLVSGVSDQPFLGGGGEISQETKDKAPGHPVVVSEEFDASFMQGVNGVLDNLNENLRQAEINLIKARLSVGDFFNSLKDGVVEGTKNLYEAMTGWIPLLFDPIREVSAGLKSDINEIITFINTNFGTDIQLIGTKVPTMLSSGMESNRSYAEETAGSIATVIKDRYAVLPEHTLAVGGQSSKQLGAGIGSGKDGVTTNTQGIFDTIMTTLDPLNNDTNPIGVAVSAGLVAGMQAVGLADPVQGLVNLVINAFKKGFNINSPSKETEWIGENIVFGLINGLSSIELGSFADNMVSTLVEAFKSGAIKAQQILDVLGENAKDALKLVGITFGATANQLGMPLNSSDITSSFGYRADPFTGETKFHAGTDFGAAMGDSVFATGDGKVVQAGENGGYGLSVTIDHGNGLETLYGHLSEILTSVGKQVSIGELIGLVGSTGNSTGPHLHYEVRQDGSPIAPGFAIGTNMFRGGKALVNEKGGEIIDLPSGSQIIPHDKTVEVSKAQGEAEAYKQALLAVKNQQTQLITSEPQDNRLIFSEGSVTIHLADATEKSAKEAATKLMKEIDRIRELRSLSVRTPIFKG
jgi:hypothetical protein